MFCRGKKVTEIDVEEIAVIFPSIGAADGAVEAKLKQPLANFIE